MFSFFFLFFFSGCSGVSPLLWAGGVSLWRYVAVLFRFLSGGKRAFCAGSCVTDFV